MELEFIDQLLESVKFGDDLGYGARIVFLDRKLEQVAGVRQARRQLVERDDDILEPRPFLSECLCAFRLLPDVGFLEFAPDLGQALRLALVVKGTSSTP